MRSKGGLPAGNFDRVMVLGQQVDEVFRLPTSYRRKQRHEVGHRVGGRGHISPQVRRHSQRIRRSNAREERMYAAHFVDALRRRAMALFGRIRGELLR
jgi:hypothetical protein